MRITKAALIDLEKQVKHHLPAVRYGGRYNYHAVDREIVTPNGTGEDVLCTGMSASEAFHFLSGMLAACQMMEEKK